MTDPFTERREPTEQRAQARRGWARYFAGNHWFGYPPPSGHPAQAILGTIILFVLLLSLIVTIAMGVTR